MLYLKTLVSALNAFPYEENLTHEETLPLPLLILGTKSFSWWCVIFLTFVLSIGVWNLTGYRGVT